MADKEHIQKSLIDLEEDWQQHWQGMPEFVQEDLRPLKSIMVHFETREDIAAFSKLVGQSVSLTTKAIWYPEAEIGRTKGKRYAAGNSVLYSNRSKPE